MEIAKKDRIYYFDNLKFFLIILVVFGHIINSLFPLDSRGAITNIIWNSIYIFHMPLFVLISGYFSKKYDQYSVNTLIILTDLLLPYILFNSLFYLFHRKIMMPILPDSAMWYLYALIFWRLTLPLLLKIKYILAISFFVSVMSNFISVGIDDYSILILKYLPFFILGYFLTEEQIMKIRSRSMTIITLVTMLSVAIVFLLGVLLNIDISGEMLYARSSQVSLTSQIFVGRIFCLMLSVIICFYFIAIVPNKRFIFTHIGSCTMLIYLFHYLPIMQKFYRKVIPQNNELLALVLSFIFAIVITFVLSRKFFVNLYNKFFDIINKLVLKQKG